VTSVHKADYEIGSQCQSCSKVR